MIVELSETTKKILLSMPARLRAMEEAEREEAEKKRQSELEQQTAHPVEQLSQNRDVDS